MPSCALRRYALLGGAAFSQGLTVAPLVGVVLELHPAMVLTAFLGTSAVFLCFSAAALMSKRRSFLYLGATLSSAITTFMMMRLATWMFGGRALAFQAELYLGLLVFVGYVLFDTQACSHNPFCLIELGSTLSPQQDWLCICGKPLKSPARPGINVPHMQHNTPQRAGP